MPIVLQRLSTFASPLRCRIYVVRQKQFLSDLIDCNKPSTRLPCKAKRPGQSMQDRKTDNPPIEMDLFPWNSQQVRCLSTQADFRKTGNFPSLPFPTDQRPAIIPMLRLNLKCNQRPACQRLFNSPWTPLRKAKSPAWSTYAVAATARTACRKSV